MSTNNNGQAERFVIPIGPQHPALKEPGHFEFVVDGEIVQSASIRLGYAHRGIEKATESRSWTQNLYLLERVCGICSHIHAMAYCLGVEALAGVEAPPRAQVIRTIIAELERVHSHLLWLGVAAHEAGFDTLFMLSWRDRETVMDLLENITGNRVNYSANLLGGVKYDIEPHQHTAILSGLDFLEERSRHYLNVISEDQMLKQRTVGVGLMNSRQATSSGLTGPTARASGILRDVRVDAPYAAYRQHQVRMIVHRNGDLQARFIVRMLELLESFRLIRELLAEMPEGELTTRMPRKIKAGEAITRVEAPRGELFYFIRSNGTDKPDRIKIRTPTLSNMASVAQLTPGQHLADVPMILVGIDPCFSCNDRQIVLRQEQAEQVTDYSLWNWQELRNFGIAHYAKGDKA